MSEVIAVFKSLRAGSQVFARLMLFLCVILHTMLLGKKEPEVAMHLTFSYVVLVCHKYVCKNYVGSVYVGLRESGLWVFRKLCSVGLLVVDEVRRFCCSLQCHMLIVVMVGKCSDNSAC